MLSLVKGLLNVLPGEGKDDIPIGPSPAAPATAANAEPGTTPAAAGSVTEPAAADPAVTSAAAPAKEEPKVSNTVKPEEVKYPISGHGVTALTLSEVGEILSAQGCASVFGCDASELVSQNIRVLLKGGLDNEVGRFLHRQHAGRTSGTSSLRVIALRKDKTEFPASITTVVLKSDSKMKAKSDGYRFWWTAFIRDMASANDPGAVKPQPQANQEGGQYAADFFRLHESHNALEKANEELLKQLQELSQEGPRIQLPAGGISPEALEQAKTGQARAEKGWQEERQRVNRLEVELADLRSAREAVSLNTSGGDSLFRMADLEMQLRQAQDELEALKTRALDHTQGTNELELQTSLEAAREAERAAVARAEKLEDRLQNLVSSLKAEQADRSKRVEAELLALRGERDELNARLASEQQDAVTTVRRAEELEEQLARNAAEAERAKAELARQNAAHQLSESEWKEQLDTAWFMKSKLEAECAGALERNKQVEEELAKLQRDRDALNKKLAAEQKAAGEARDRVEQVEARLGHNASELGKRSAEREREEQEWREAVEVANAHKEKLTADYAKAVERNQALEKDLASIRQNQATFQGQLSAAAKRNQTLEAELAALRQDHATLQGQLRAEQSTVTSAQRQTDKRSQALESELAALRQDQATLQGQLSAEQEAAAAAQRQADEAQARLDQAVAELEQARTDSLKRTSDLPRQDARWREQLEAVKAQKKELETAWSEAVERTMQFEEELTQLRHECDEWKSRDAAERTVAGEIQLRMQELERQAGEFEAELGQARAELQDQQADRERAESDWRQQLETAKALAKKLEITWTGAAERNKRFEAELVTMRQERDEFKARLAAAAAPKPAPRNDELEARLNQSLAETTRLRAELAKYQAAERQRAELERRKAANLQAPRPSTAAPTAANAPVATPAAAPARPVSPPAPKPVVPRPAPATPAPVPAPRPAAAPASTPLRAAQPATPVARPAQPKPTPQRFEDAMRKAPPIARQYKLSA
jgi:chromosome segregation ATPase